MKITNELNLPQPLVDAVSNDDYDRGDSDYTVTELLNPPKANRIVKDHWDEIEEDVSDQIYALMGKAVHSILEKSDKVAMTEDRYYVKIDGMRVSGKYDRLAIGSEAWWGKYMKFAKMISPNVEMTMQDYKIASVWEYIFGVKPEKVAQVNMLAYIARKNGYNVTKGQLVFIFRDWKKTDARYKSNYPRKQVAIVNVEMWPDWKIEAYIRDRVKLHEDAKQALPDCTNDEIWAQPEKFAVMKEGRKTAVKLCVSKEEAEEYIVTNAVKAGYVEHRKKPPSRCRDYCRAFAFCEQGKSYYTGEENEENGEE